MESMSTEAINAQQELEVSRATFDCIDRAAGIFQRDFKHIPLHFDLKGRAAGQYRVRHGQAEIRYNPYLFARYYEDNLAHTVVHEVAHYLTDQIYGQSSPGIFTRRRIKPHGEEWKSVMRRLGAEPVRTCQYDLSGVPLRRVKYYDYACLCQAHRLSSIRHNRVMAGKASYHCKQCRGQLRPAE